jgi:ankyrin repeat protein
LKRLRAKDVFTDARDVKLAEAVALGDRAAIDAAIKAGANVNGRGDKGMPMLMWAMVKDSVAGFDALLENGADLKALANDPAFTRKGERTKEVIELVVSGTNGDFLKTALAHGFNPNYVPDSYMNESLLFRSVWSHAIPNARLLLEAGADIDHLDSNKRPPIDLAMGIGHYEMVFFLLSSGADPCIKTNGYDLAGMMKEFGTRGVTEKEYPHFLRVVAELKKRGLITDEDITQADNKKPFSDPQP